MRVLIVFLSLLATACQSSIPAMVPPVAAQDSVVHPVVSKKTQESIKQENITRVEGVVKSSSTSSDGKTLVTVETPTIPKDVAIIEIVIKWPKRDQE